MAAPKYMRPVMELGIWFHELPPLATINGAIIATDASTTVVGMVRVLVHERTRGEYNTRVALGVGTSQEGEAMTLLLYVRWLAPQEGSFGVVPTLSPL